uniref:Uncharacterized protein n=1 Tax=Cucumis melo subsp. melo TaxID=412675 RepID=E5GB31_CUCME|nr:hypothetical protein [Cucumis melo subsp. melo]
MKLCSKQVLLWLPETLHRKKVVVDRASNPPPRAARKRPPQFAIIVKASAASSLATMLFSSSFSIRHSLVSCVDVAASSSADRFRLTVVSDAAPSTSRSFSRCFAIVYSSHF